MSIQDPGVHYIFTWHSLDTACRQCQSLNGYQWTDADIYQNTLWSPFYGDVWSLDLGLPLTHGGTGINCRCWVDVQTIINLAEITTLQELGILLETDINETVEVEPICLR
jgi:hypothetical protein